jgi:hypothetical protein
VVDGARRGDHDVAGHVPQRVEASDLGHGRAGDDRRPADDGPSQRVVAEHRFAEYIEDLLLRIVLVHRDLLEDHRALGFDFVERRTKHHVGHHVERLGDVLIDYARVDRGGLLAGACVELGAHAVEDLVDLQRAVPCRALEQQVLDQMREPRLTVALAARAGADPEAERDRTDRGHGLGHHADSRRERGQAVLFTHLGVVRSRGRATRPASGARAVRVTVAHPASVAVAIAVAVAATAIAAVASPPVTSVTSVPGAAFTARRTRVPGPDAG